MQHQEVEIRIKGKPIRVNSVRVDNKVIIMIGKSIRIARFEGEWHEDIEHPESIIKAMKDAKIKADIFTFWQRLPEIKPRYSYHQEWESVAALPTKSYDYWWEKQITAKTRNVIRKAENKGVETKVVKFDEEFIKGITNVFNESPIRQAKPFWHFGKDYETSKLHMSDRLDKAEFIGAYYKNELIGFIKLLHAGRYLMMVEILSMIKHRDKAPNNALIAKAVEVCDNAKIPYLVYANWWEGSLSDFKRHNGFEKINLPRYYVPLTITGTIALKLNLHYGLAGILPKNLKNQLVNIRSKWYLRKFPRK